MLTFLEGPMLIIKENASLFGSDLGGPPLELHSQLSSLGWPCLRIESQTPFFLLYVACCSYIGLTLCLLSRSTQ